MVTLEIDLSDSEVERWRRLADEAGMDLAAWVRDAVRQAESTRDRDRLVDPRMAAVERAFAHPSRLDLPPLHAHLASEGDRYGVLPRP